MLRPYQQDAVDAATLWMRRSIMPGLLELATGSGKSHIVAALAEWFTETSGKRVLCLQPSKELTEQNHEKFLATGNHASIFSASAGGRCMRYPVIYGTPGTVKNSLSRFGDMFGAVIIDEAHGITPTIKTIVAGIQKQNPRLRVLGMTATPYRTTSGYIYQYDTDGRFIDESQARDPYFNTLLYRIQTNELIDQGFLTPAHADPDHAASYEAGNMQLNSRGQFDASDIEKVFEGRGRLTADIVADVVKHAHGRQGVMIFAATVQHAKEVLASLPPGNAMMLGGTVNMEKPQREKLINDFKARRFKYLVSVATLTTGFDAPHVDLIAILRATESPGLFQQIIGRGLRLDVGKTDCMVLDYAENIERHGLHDDLFRPKIKTKKEAAAGGAEIECPDCGYVNLFAMRPDYLDMPYDKYGYVLDLDGERVMGDHGAIPAHFGRRCTGQVTDAAQPGVLVRCPSRWTSKECPECSADNDIAARYCCSCKAEIVDPNEKLRLDFMRIKKDPYAISTDAVLAWEAYPHTSQSGASCVRCVYQTEWRTFTVFYSPESKHPKAQMAFLGLVRAVFGEERAMSIWSDPPFDKQAETFIKNLEEHGQPPKTVTYRKQKNSDFYEVLDHNAPVDVAPPAKESDQ